MTTYEITISCLKGLFKLFFRHSVKMDPSLLSIEGSVIIAPNHASFLDPILVAISWDKKDLHFFATEDIFRNKIFGYLLKKLNCHPIVRGEELSSIRLACTLLEEGKSIVIFPEGTRSTDGKIAFLRHGVALLSLRTKRPVIPCYLQGTYACWPRHKKYPKLFQKTACIFGPPCFPPDQVPVEKKKAFQEDFTRLIHQELHRLSQ